MEEIEKAGEKKARNKQTELGLFALGIAFGLALGMAYASQPIYLITNNYYYTSNSTATGQPDSAPAPVPAYNPPNLQSFTQCIANSGIKFYGAYWCSHCANQKAMFGDYAGMLPYIECDTGNQTLTTQCEAAGIQGFPTWIYQNQQLVGEQTFAQISAATGCK